MNNIKDKVYYKFMELFESGHSTEIQAQMMGEFVRKELNEANRILASQLKELNKRAIKEDI